ncbi:MAG: hypothetical protein JJU11_12625 [Candidatus Sumerlaeia bacterium]|nr:hypothetical protein [Candidatus Sumerlaeia bacterium]
MQNHFSKIPSILRKPGRRASGIILALFFTLVVSGVLAIVMSSTSQNTRDTWRTAVVENSLAGARAVAAGMAHNTMFIARTLPPQLNGTVEELDDFILSMQPIVPPGYSIAEDPSGNPLVFHRDLGPNDFQYDNIETPGDEWFGYSTARLDWDVYAVVREDSERADYFDFPGIGMKKRVTIDYIPLYQFAIFYEGDLELHPGPVMDIRGRVHSNQDLYLSAVDTLRVHERVTSAGYFYRFRGQSGVVTIRGTDGEFHSLSPDNNPNDSNDWLESLDENWIEESIDRWGGNLRDTNHGILPINPPLPSGAETFTMIQRATSTDSAAIQEFKYENKADLVILGDPGQPNTINGYIRDSGGNLVAIDSQYVTPGHPNSFVNIGEFYDGQQMTVVKTLDIDMAKLTAANVADFNAGSGIIYASTTPSDVDPDPFTPTSVDPVWERDPISGEILFGSNGIARVVPGQEGWWNPSSDPRRPGLDNFMPAVRVINSQTLPANSSNGFGLYTDRPLYTVGNINTNNTKTAVFAGDSVTVKSQALTLQRPILETDSHGNLLYDSSGNVVARMNSSNNEYIYGPGNTREMGPWVRTHNNHEIQYDWRGDLHPRASHTTTNVIFLMGNTPPAFKYSVREYNEEIRTINGETNPLVGPLQSGGAHNVMRYLENWSSRNHNFLGSMIILWESQLAVSKNHTGSIRRGRTLNGGRYNYYEPPRRNYDWDNRLQGSQPPPGMPLFLEVREGPWERVSYDEAVAAYNTRRWSMRSSGE